MKTDNCALSVRTSSYTLHGNAIAEYILHEMFIFLFEGIFERIIRSHLVVILVAMKIIFFFVIFHVVTTVSTIALIKLAG